MIRCATKMNNYSDEVMEIGVDEYERLCIKTKSMYEQIPDDQPVSLYGDLDLKMKDLMEGAEMYDCTMQLIGIAKRGITDAIQALGGITPPRFANKTATKIDGDNPKISFHIIVTNYKMPKIQQDEFFKSVNKLIDTYRDDKWAEDFLEMTTDRRNGGFFDMSVYSRGRKMRSPFSTKEGQDRPFKIIEGTFRDCIISMPSTDAQLLEIALPEKKTPVASVASVTGDNAVEKYCDYMSLIPASRWNSYMDWFKIQRASANLGIPFDVHDKFMRPCTGYDLDNNLRVYQMPPDDKNGQLGWNHIRQAAYDANPKGKMEIDQKWREDEIFCKFKFANIKDPADTEDVEELRKKLQLAELKEKKMQIKEFTANIDTLIAYEKYKLQKAYFEKFHFKCMNPPCYVRKTEDGYSMLSHEKFAKLYVNLNGFIEKWLKDLHIREYERCVFNPPPMTTNSNEFNLYTGMKYEKINAYIPEDEFLSNSRIFIKHMWYLSGKNNAVLEYLLNYFAHLIQRPAELPRTAIVMKSEQGCGKSFFLEQFGDKIVGANYTLSTTKLDDILGRFPMISQKFLVIMDETEGKDTFGANENIKSLITSPTVTFERKGVDGIQIKNCGRLFFNANGDYPVKIEQTDRRFLVTLCSNDIKNDTVYFKALIAAFNNETLVKSFALFLKTRDISKFDPTNDRPITQIYKSMQTVTIPLEQRFFTEYTMFPYGEEQKGKQIFTLYSDWARFHSKKPIAEHTFLVRLKNYPFIVKERTTSKKFYIINETAHQEYIQSIDAKNEIDEDEEDEYPDKY